MIDDYTNVCPHKLENNDDHVQIWNDLQKQMQEKANDKNIKKKIEALKKVIGTIDSMSTVKETAYAIIRGQFSEVLTMFLRKDLNELLGDNSERSCKECSYSEEGEENLLIIEHALLILNRCLKF